MQIVKWGKKQRQVKVPVGWAFIRDGKTVKERDKFFNLMTHAWDNVEQDDLGDPVGSNGLFLVAIREVRCASSNEIDTNPHAVRVVLQQQ